jgi:hypothetical protein
VLSANALSPSGMKKAKALAYDKALAALIKGGIEIQKARKMLSAAKAAGMPYDMVAA